MAVLNLGLSTLSTTASITIVGSNLQLVNDSATPGNNYIYSTNSSGIKGWFTLASFGVTSITGTTNQITASASIGAVTLSLPTTLVSINSITSVAGQNLVLATGTTGTAATFTSATNALTLSQGALTFTGATTVTGGAGNMTIVSGTGASRTLIFQTTTSGSAATTALTLGADQSATIAGNLTVSGTGASTLGAASSVFTMNGAVASTTTSTGTLIISGAGGLGVGGAINVGTTGTFTGNVTAPDYLLGASGPSVKSSLGARGPRQGLVSDGVSGQGSTSVAVGTTDFSVSAWVNPTSFAAARYIFGGAANSFAFYLHTDGKPTVIKMGGAALTAGTTALTAGKMALLVYTRVDSTDTGTYYLNGVAIGTAADVNDYSVATTLVGSTTNATTMPFLGTIAQPLIYNRALTAAEVLSLFESGAPAASDHAAPINAGAAVLTGNDSTFATGLGSWAAEGGSALTNPSANMVITSTAAVSNQGAYNQSKVTVGQKYRASITASVNTGTVQLVVGGAAPQTITTTPTVYTYTWTHTAGQGTTLYIYWANTASVVVTIDDFTVTPLGLLLAPDENSGGAGSTWAAAPGTSATITLPASGVAWAIPRNTIALGTTATYAATLAGDATGGLTITPVTTVNLVKTSAGAITYPLLLTNVGGNSDGSGVGINFDAFDAAGTSILGRIESVREVGGGKYSLRFSNFINSSALTETMRLSGTGNLLIGGTTDITGSGNLAVYGGLAKIKGGTTTGVLELDTTSNGTANVKFYDVGSLKWQFYRDASHQLNIRDETNGVTVAHFTQGAIGAAAFKVNATTPSTTTTSGSLINAGGFGNAGAAYFGGLINSTQTTSGTNKLGTSTADGAASRLHIVTPAVAGNAYALLLRNPDTSNTHAVSMGFAAETTQSGAALAELQAIRTSIGSGYHDFIFSSWNGSALAEKFRIAGGATGTGTVTVSATTTATTSAGALRVGALTGSDYVNIGGGKIFTGSDVTVGGNLLSNVGFGTGVSSVVTAAGTTTLTNASTTVQILTGSTTQNVQLPAAALFGAGVAVVYCFSNRSTGGAITLLRAGSDLIESNTSFVIGIGERIWLISDGVSQWSVI